MASLYRAMAFPGELIEGEVADEDAGMNQGTIVGILEELKTSTSKFNIFL